MTRLLRSLWVVALGVIALACSKDDPLPRSTVEFTNELIEVGIPVMFDNLTLNADRYEWKFSDGQTSEEISPTVTFTSPGPIEVVLKAFTKDNQVDSIVKPLTVRQRFLTAYSVTIYPTKNGTGDWDEGADPENVFPDIVVQFIPDRNFDPEEVLFHGPFNNVDIPAFSVEIPAANQIVLTNESWSFVIFDFDGTDIITATNDDFVPMAGTPDFNPVLVNTIKNNAGDKGLITLFFPEDENNPAFGLDLFFDIK